MKRNVLIGKPLYPHGPPPLLTTSKFPGAGRLQKSACKIGGRPGATIEGTSATKATQKEYSGALGFQTDSKIEPELEPKVIQKGSLLKNPKKTFFAAIYYT